MSLFEPGHNPGYELHLGSRSSDGCLCARIDRPELLLFLPNQEACRTDYFSRTGVAWTKIVSPRGSVAHVAATLEPPLDTLGVTYWSWRLLADHRGGISNVCIAWICRKPQLQALGTESADAPRPAGESNPRLRQSRHHDAVRGAGSRPTSTPGTNAASPSPGPRQQTNSSPKHRRSKIIIHATLGRPPYFSVAQRVI